MANAGLFAQYIKPVRSMQEYAADYDAQEQNALMLAAKRMEMQAAERASMEDRDFAELTRTSGGDLNALYRAAMGRGLYGKAQGVQKSIDERATADLNRRKTEAELEQQRRKAADDYYAVYETARSRFLGDPNISKQKVVTSLQQLAAIGRLPADLVEKLTANLSEDPNELRADIESGDISKLSPEKRIELFAPKTEWKDDGQRLIPIQTNPRAPGYVAPTPIQKVATPGEVLTDTRTREEGAKNRDVTIRGQNLTDARAKDRLNIESGNAVAEAGGPSQVALVKQFGKAPPGYRWKNDGTVEAIPGGPADIKAGEAGAKASAKRDAQIAQAEGVLGTIREAKDLVGYTTAGAGGLAAKVPMTDARNLQAKLDTVKANLGFDRLQQMRDNSPTGGALGAVAVQELVALQSTVASLDQLQSPGQLRSALDKIDRHYTRWLEVMKQAGGGQGGATGGWGDKPAGGKGGPVDFGSLK